MENEELIRQQMAETRESLTDKVELLENKIMHTVETATTAVNETVSNVKETVQESVESVKEAVNLEHQVDHHPWLVFGGSILCGYLTAQLLSAGQRERSAPSETQTRPQGRRHMPTGNGVGAHPKLPAPQPTAGESWLGPIEPELQRLKALALGAALGAARELVTDEVPEHMGEQLRSIIDGITQKVGGDILPSADFAGLKSEPHGSGFDPDKPRW